MITLGIFTTTRAEYGILSALLREIVNSEGIDYKLFVGGTHLASEYGLTINEIKKNNYKITDTFDYLLNNDDPDSLVRSMGVESFGLSYILSNYYIDYTFILGDRYELIPIVLSSILFKKPIIHLHGGEATEGIIDEQIRHMITKAAHIHFVACEEYKNNIRKMGEPEWRIYNVGALGIDNIVNEKYIEKKTLFNELGLKDKKTVLLTYHPVTLEYKINPLTQIKNIFKALDEFNFQIVITSPNIEVGRDVIIDYIKKVLNKNRGCPFIESLGVKRYQSLIPHCEFVIGNSSSGINEVPFFKIPTINIGDRQKGRVRHESVIDTGYSVNSIIKGIQRAIEPNFKKRLKKMDYKFGNGHAAERILKILKDIEINEQLMRKKLDFSAYE